MDLQDVANLTIPEGGVKTIHDNDNRLLWGAVGYGTKYAGNTTQQTYSGKNLFNINTTPSWIGAGTTYSVSGNKLHVEGAWFVGIEVAVEKNTDYYISATRNNLSSASAAGNISVYDVNKSTTIIGLGKNNGTFNSGNRTNVYILFYCDSGNAGNYADFENIQIEKGTSGSSYEPYTGGSPAPNPLFPMPVNVVTGVQTVTVSDGGSNTQTYTIDLGATEFYKLSSVSGAPSILSYQDYIYKSGSDWYIHKEIEKAVYDGSVDEEWGLHNTYNSIVGFRWVGAGAGHSNSAILSEKLLPIYITTYNSNNRTYGKIATLESSSTSVNSTVFITAPNSSVTTLAQFTSWLSNNNVTVYYASATPTDTQITDATLVGQLDAVHEWLTRYGYNATVTGNLPIIIDRTNL